MSEQQQQQKKSNNNSNKSPEDITKEILGTVPTVDENENSESNAKSPEDITRSILGEASNTGQKQSQTTTPGREEPKNKVTNFFSDAWKSIKSGFYSGGSGIFQFLDNLNIGKQDERDLKNKYGSIDKAAKENDPKALLYGDDKEDEDKDRTLFELGAQELRQKAVEASPDIDMDIIGSAANGDWGTAIYKLSMGVFNTSPQIVAMLGASIAGSPGAGLGIIGTSAAGNKYQELIKKEGFTDNQKRSISAVHGLLEVVTEKLGTSRLIEDIVNNPAAKQGLKQGFVKVISKFVGTEAGEEFINSLAGDAVDKITGIEPDITGYSAGKNAINSGLVGFGMGASLAGVRLTVGSPPADAGDNTAAADDSGDGGESSGTTDIQETVASKIVEKFNYNESRTESIKETMDIVDNMGEQYNVDPSIIAGLMKIESDFVNVENETTSAIGPLQVTEAAIEDIERVGGKLHNSLDTKEGRIEAGVRYFQMLRDHYGFNKDQLIAAYFAGPGFVRNNGINNVVIEDQISTQEYVNRFKEAHSSLINMDTNVKTAEVSTQDTETETTSTETQKETNVEAGLDNVETIQRSLDALGYQTGKINGKLDVDTLSSLTQFQLDYGLDWDTINNRDTLLDTEFKDTIKQALEDNNKTDLLSEIESQETEAETVEDIAADTEAAQSLPKPDPGDYWEKYKHYLTDTQGRKAVEKDPEAEMPNKVEVKTEQRDTSEYEEMVDWYLERNMETPYNEGFELANMTKPSEGDSINTTRILQDPKTLKSIKKMADIVNDETVQTHEELKSDVQSQFDTEDVNEMVKELGLVKDSAEGLAKAVQQAPETVLALRETVSSNATKLKQLAKEIKSSKGKVGELKLAQFINHLELQKSLTGTLKDIWKQFGRTLSQGQIYVEGKMMHLSDMEPAHLERTIDGDIKVQELVDGFGGKDKIIDIADDIADEDFDISDVSEKSREVFKKRLTKAAVELRTSNLFRSIDTHFRNITSQFLNMVTEWGANMTSATVNLVRRSDEATSLDEANQNVGMTYTEAIKRFAGDMVGWYNSMFKPIVPIQEAAETIYNEKPSKFNLLTMAAFHPAKFEKIFEASQLDSRIAREGMRRHRLKTDYLFPKIDSGDNTLSNLMSKAFDNFGAILRLSSFGALEAGDRFFSYGGYTSEMAGQLHLLKKTDALQNMSKENQKQYLNQIKEGALALRKVKTLDSYISERAVKLSSQKGIELSEARSQIENELTNGTLKDMSDEMLKKVQKIDEAAMQHASEMTWKDPFEEGSLARWVEKGAAKHPIMRVVFPILHTPLKILQKGWNWSNPLAKQMRKDLSGNNGKRAQTQAVGKLIVSGLLFTWGATLIGSGRLTPGARDEKERRRMELAGVPPHSVKIGDKWYDYNQWDPFPSYFFTVLSNGYRSIYEAQEDRDLENGKEKVQQATSEAFFSILSSLMDKTMLIEVESLVDAANGIGAESYLERLGESFNPTYTLRRNWETKDPFNNNPFYKEYRETDKGFVKRDMFGKPVMNYKVIAGSRVVEESDSRIRQELFDLGVTLPRMRDTFNGVELTEEQHNQLLRFFDEKMKAEDKMNQLVTSSAYRNATKDQKIKMIRDRWENLKANAKSTLYRNKDYVQKYLEYEKEQQRKKLTGDDYLYNFFREGKPIDIDVDIESFWDLLKDFNPNSSSGEEGL